MIESPCLNCPDRRVLCWNECEKYLAYRTRLDEINEQLYQESFAEGFDIEQRRKASRKNRK